MSESGWARWLCCVVQPTSSSDLLLLLRTMSRLDRRLRDGPLIADVVMASIVVCRVSHAACRKKRINEITQVMGSCRCRTCQRYRHADQIISWTFTVMLFHLATSRVTTVSFVQQVWGLRSFFVPWTPCDKRTRGQPLTLRQTMSADSRDASHPRWWDYRGERRVRGLRGEVGGASRGAKLRGDGI